MGPSQEKRIREMKDKLPEFPVPPDGKLQYRDDNGEWKDCSYDWQAWEGHSAHEYRTLPPTNEQTRKWAHEIVDYFADVAETGEVCGVIEKRCLIIFVKDNRITFGVGEQ